MSVSPTELCFLGVLNVTPEPRCARRGHAVVFHALVRDLLRYNEQLLMSAVSEMGIDNREEWNGAFLNDIDKPDLHACHGVGYVDEAKLKPLGRFGSVAPQADLDAVKFISIVVAEIMHIEGWFG